MNRSCLMPDEHRHEYESASGERSVLDARKAVGACAPRWGWTRGRGAVGSTRAINAAHA